MGGPSRRDGRRTRTAPENQRPPGARHGRDSGRRGTAERRDAGVLFSLERHRARRERRRVSGAGRALATPGRGGRAAPPDPETEWRTYCGTLEPAVGQAATSITDAGKRTAFRGLNPVEQRTFAAPELNAALRDAFLAFTREDRTAIRRNVPT